MHCPEVHHNGKENTSPHYRRQCQHHACMSGMNQPNLIKRHSTRCTIYSQTLGGRSTPFKNKEAACHQQTQLMAYQKSSKKPCKHNTMHKLIFNQCAGGFGVESASMDPQYAQNLLFALFKHSYCGRLFPPGQP